MKPGSWKRRALIGAVVAAIFLAAAPDDGQRAEPKQAHAGVPKAVESGPPPQPALKVELERLQRPAAKTAPEPAVGNAFSATSWYVPPPPPPPPPPRKPPPPPPPTAPPMPFSYLGRYEEAGGLVILLVKNERIYTVSVGDVIENIYRVDAYAPGRLELTYLPLDIRQTISTGGS